MEDSNIVFEGGAKRSDAKPMYRKIPLSAMRLLSEVLTRGSLRYDKGIYHSNWRSGNDEFAAACFDHAIEHMYKWIEGDTTEAHLGHAMANIAFLIHFQETGVFNPELNYRDAETGEALDEPEDDVDLDEISDEDFAVLFNDGFEIELEDEDLEDEPVDEVPEPSEKLQEAAFNWKKIFGMTK